MTSSTKSPTSNKYRPDTFAKDDKKRRHARTGLRLKPGAVNKTETNVKSRTLLLTAQPGQRAHFLHHKNINSKKDKRKDTNSSSSGEDTGSDLYDYDGKEWRSGVKLACAHLGHHSVKARKDALERLKRLLKNIPTDDKNLLVVKGLVLDSLIQEWCREDDEKAGAMVLSLSQDHLFHGACLVGGGNNSSLEAMKKLQAALHVTLTHTRPQVRLFGRKLLASILQNNGNNEGQMEDGNHPPLIDPIPLMQALLIHMRTLGAHEEKSPVPSDVRSLMPKLLEMLIIKTNDLDEDAHASLEYTWQAERQTRPLCILRDPRKTFVFTQSKSSNLSQLKSIIGSFWEKVKLACKHDTKNGQHAIQVIEAVCRSHSIAFQAEP